MKTARLRNKILEYLTNHNNPATAREIYEYINRTYRWGVTMHALANILKQTPGVEKVEVKTMNHYMEESSLTYPAAVWGLKI